MRPVPILSSGGMMEGGMGSTRLTLVLRDNETGKETVVACSNMSNIAIIDGSGGSVVDEATGESAGAIACGVIYIMPPFGCEAEPSQLGHLDQDMLRLLEDARRLSGNAFGYKQQSDGSWIAWRNYGPEDAIKARRGLRMLAPSSSTTH